MTMTDDIVLLSADTPPVAFSVSSALLMSNSSHFQRLWVDGIHSKSIYQGRYAFKVDTSARVLELILPTMATSQDWQASQASEALPRSPSDEEPTGDHFCEALNLAMFFEAERTQTDIRCQFMAFLTHKAKFEDAIQACLFAQVRGESAIEDLAIERALVCKDVLADVMGTLADLGPGENATELAEKLFAKANAYKDEARESAYHEGKKAAVKAINREHPGLQIQRMPTSLLDRLKELLEPLAPSFTAFLAIVAVVILRHKQTS